MHLLSSHLTSLRAWTPEAQCCRGLQTASLDSGRQEARQWAVTLEKRKEFVKWCKEPCPQIYTVCLGLSLCPYTISDLSLSFWLLFTFYIVPDVHWNAVLTSSKYLGWWGEGASKYIFTLDSYFPKRWPERKTTWVRYFVGVHAIPFNLYSSPRSRYWCLHCTHEKREAPSASKCYILDSYPSVSFLSQIATSVLIGS